MKLSYVVVGSNRENLATRWVDESSPTRSVSEIHINPSNARQVIVVYRAQHDDALRIFQEAKQHSVEAYIEDTAEEATERALSLV